MLRHTEDDNASMQREHLTGLLATRKCECHGRYVHRLAMMPFVIIITCRFRYMRACKACRAVGTSAQARRSPKTCQVDTISSWEQLHAGSSDFSHQTVTSCAKRSAMILLHVHLTTRQHAQCWRSGLHLRLSLGTQRSHLLLGIVELLGLCQTLCLELGNCLFVLPAHLHRSTRLTLQLHALLTVANRAGLQMDAQNCQTSDEHLKTVLCVACKHIQLKHSSVPLRGPFKQQGTRKHNACSHVCARPEQGSIRLAMETCCIAHKHHLLKHAHHGGEGRKPAVAVAVLQADGPQAVRHHHTLCLVIRRWHALECLDAFHRFLAAHGLVRHHPAIHRKMIGGHLNCCC